MSSPPDRRAPTMKDHDALTKKKLMASDTDHNWVDQYLPLM
ncbi:MAG TPA: hypothetical protein VFV47_00615 [Hyphomicrobiaceae bacterium]|nr:hypothetical protein [Hyphomicrobiaceae bacterium]